MYTVNNRMMGKCLYFSCCVEFQQGVSKQKSGCLKINWHFVSNQTCKDE